MRLRPSEAEYVANLALALGRSGRWSRAAEALHRLAVLCPGQAEPRLLLAAALRRAGLPGRAMRAFRDATPLAAPPAGRLSRLGGLLVGAHAWRALLADHAAAARVAPPQRAIQRLGGLWGPRRRHRKVPAGRVAPRPIGYAVAAGRRAG